MEAIEAARAVVAEQHPEARAAFLGGSVVAGLRTATSDLDVVVLLHEAPAPYRTSLQYAGLPVEMFVHTEATWHAYVERELRKRRSPLLWMCADGLLLFDTDGLGARLAAQARKLTAAGPPPVSSEEIDDRRYAINDLLDDLAGSDDQSELLFIATQLVRSTGELALAVGGSAGARRWTRPQTRCTGGGRAPEAGVGPVDLRIAEPLQRQQRIEHHADLRAELHIPRGTDIAPATAINSSHLRALRHVP